EAVATAIDVKLRWLGEQARRGLSFLSGALPGRHVALEVACEPSVSEAFGCFPHSGCGPAHRHRGRAPAFYVAADAPHRAHHILDNVGAGERAPQLLPPSKPRYGRGSVDAFQDRAGDPGPVSFETLGEVAEQLFGLVGIVKFPCLSQHTPDRSVERFGESLHNVASLVDLTALDRRGSSEGPADRLGQGLRAVDDEQ